MRTSLSPKQIALALGVSESSLKRWADDGRLSTTRTVGGHRRITLQEAIRFARETELRIVRPDVLGLPDLGRAKAFREDPAQVMFEKLRSGSADDVRAMVLDAYLSGETVAAICDGPLTNALHRIGELWAHDSAGIFVEHRATDICIQTLNLLRMLIVGAGGGSDQDAIEADHRPVALGGAPAGDPYVLPSLMCACVMAEQGYHEVNLGANTPEASLRGAAEHYRPRLVWMSLSQAEPTWPSREELVALSEHLGAQGAELAVGGRGLNKLRPVAAPHLHLCDSMGELAAYAHGLIARKAS